MPSDFSQIMMLLSRMGGKKMTAVVKRRIADLQENSMEILESPLRYVSPA